MLNIVKKKNILLFEILLAIAIVSLCAIPIARHPIMFFRSQIKSLHQMEYERIADLSFLEIKEKLYRNEIPWDKMAHTKEQAQKTSLKKTLLEIDELQPLEIERAFYLWWNKEKKGQENTTYRLIKVAVDLGPQDQKNKKRFSYRLLAEKKSA